MPAGIVGAHVEREETAVVAFDRPVRGRIDGTMKAILLNCFKLAVVVRNFRRCEICHSKFQDHMSWRGCRSPMLI